MAKKLKPLNTKAATTIKTILTFLSIFNFIFTSQIRATEIPADEYIPYHPTGCRYIKKNPDERFRYIQTCSRTGNEWEQVIEATVSTTIGVIRITRQKLIDGQEIYGYWCSGSAPIENGNTFLSDKFYKCTKSGWEIMKQ